ncbi:hypothetical protein HOK51_10685 [Candidatus Woesearchaeota archaeon]|jgi:aspartate carbamoyltransferase regulatory subunit|nr:hypothetical protein [Candidatus Woesearchaeota archaeon]MBT6520287.1 hypothetical protein [Candidatus Woesearchaeota archaeon]MBT7367307.1 hypothetical protein [Candidatus Woesearchaeota archaeon]
MVKTDIRNYLRIRPIEEGIVIDHLRPGTGLFILNLLNYEGLRVTPGLNYDTSKEIDGELLYDGKKDIMFIEGGELTSDHIGAISIVSPLAVINHIKESKVINKIASKDRIAEYATGEEYSGKLGVLEVPNSLGNILLCANPKCTTNKEGGDRCFEVIQKPTESLDLVVGCGYCEKEFYGDVIRFYTGQRLSDVGKTRYYLK